MKIIDRDMYLNTMIRVIDTPDIKVITGVRRSGKSKLLELLKKYIEKNIDNSNIIHINYNLKKFDNLLIGDKLYNYKDGNFDESYTYDGLHPNDNGYKVITKEIKKYL